MINVGALITNVLCRVKIRYAIRLNEICAFKTVVVVNPAKLCAEII